MAHSKFRRASHSITGLVFRIDARGIKDAAFAVGEPLGTILARIAANSGDSSNARRTFSRPLSALRSPNESNRQLPDHASGTSYTGRRRIRMVSVASRVFRRLKQCLSQLDARQFQRGLSLRVSHAQLIVPVRRSVRLETHHPKAKKFAMN